MYATPDDKMITRMLHLAPEKNKLLYETNAVTVWEHMPEFEIDNTTVYDIQDQICKDTDLYLYVKQYKSKRDGRGAFYAIHSRWLSSNHVNATASKSEMALQMLIYHGKKKAWNGEKYVTQHVKYHIILGNLMEYGYHGRNPGSKVRYLLNGIRCEKLSKVVATVRAHPDKYKKDFETVIFFLTQYIDKRAKTPTVKVASVSHTRPAFHAAHPLITLLQSYKLCWCAFPPHWIWEWWHP